MRPLDVFRNKLNPELTFLVLKVFQQNNTPVARGVLKPSGTHTVIRSQRLTDEWEIVR
jgi:hypothetical protein